MGHASSKDNSDEQSQAELDAYNRLLELQDLNEYVAACVAYQQALNAYNKNIEDTKLNTLLYNTSEFDKLVNVRIDSDSITNPLTPEQIQWVNDKVLTRYIGYFNVMASKFITSYLVKDSPKSFQIRSEIDEKFFLYFMKYYVDIDVYYGASTFIPYDYIQDPNYPELPGYYIGDGYTYMNGTCLVHDFPLRFLLVDKTIIDKLNQAFSAINLQLYVISLPNNLPLQINNYYVVIDFYYYQFGEQLINGIINNTIDLSKLPQIDIFNLGTDYNELDLPEVVTFDGFTDGDPNGQLVIDNKMLEYFGIPYQDIEKLIIIGEVVAIIIALFTFGLGFLIKKLIQKSLEIAYDSGAFNKVIDKLAVTLSTELGIPDITDAEAALDSHLDPVKEPLNKSLEHLSVITGISSIDFDTIPFEDAMKYSAVVDNIFNDIEHILQNAESFLADFITKIPGYIKDSVIYFIENVITKPAFWGIVSGMIAFCVVAGKTCLKFLKKMCKAIAEKIKLFIKKNFSKIKRAFQNVIKQIKNNRSKIRKLISDIRKRYLARQKKEAKKLKSKIEEEEQQIKDFLKKDFKEQLQEIKDKLHIDPISNNFDFGNYIQNNKKFLAGSTALGVGLLSTIMQRSDHFTGPLKELGRALIDIGKYGYETSIILLVLLPFLIIQYICWYVIYVLEKNYLDRNKGLLV